VAQDLAETGLVDALGGGGEARGFDEARLGADPGGIGQDGRVGDRSRGKWDGDLRARVERRRAGDRGGPILADGLGSIEVYETIDTM
jgi:hypothetical protein